MFFFLVLAFLCLPFITAACTTHADCGPAAPYCIGGSCVAYCEQDSDCQSNWADATCVMNLCSCYNEAQCPGSLICSRTDPAKGRCVICETSADRGCIERAFPACTSDTATVNLNGVPTSVTTYSCKAPSSDADCIHNALMNARDRVVYSLSGAYGAICMATGFNAACSGSNPCTSPSAAKCSSSKCTIPSSTSDCAGIPNKQAWIDNSCVECTSNGDCNTPGLGICDETTYTCVACYGDSDCPTSGQLCINNQCQTISCTDSNDCFPAYPQCAPTLGICKACATDADCIAWIGQGYVCDPSTRKCDPAPNNCILTDNCTSVTSPVCSNKLCVGCTTNTDCTNKFTSEIHCSSGTCVECTSNSQCLTPTAPICSSNQCVPCTSDAECSAISSESKCNIATGTCSSPCTEFCSICASTTTCAACDPSYYLKNGTCVQNCGSGFFEYTFSLASSPITTYQGCSPCDFTCKECQSKADKCTACNSPYSLSNFECRSTLPVLTVSLQATSNPQVFQLVFSRSMNISGDLKNNLLINFSKLSPNDFNLTSVTPKSNATIYELKFEFQKSVGAQILNVTFIDQRLVVDTHGFFVSQSSAQTDTIRFTYFSPQEKELLNSASSAGTATTSSAMASSAVIAVIAGNPALLLALMSVFQITNYFLYMNVNYPENVNAFFELFSISSFSFIPNPIEVLAPEIYEEMQVPLTSPPKFLDNELDARFLNSCGLMLTGWGIVGVSYLIIRFLLFAFRMQGLLSRLFLYFRSKFEWGLIISTLIGSFPNLFLAAILQINNLNFQGSLNQGSSIMGLATGIVCLSAPFLSIYLLDSTSNEWGSRSHHERYQSLYNGFKLLADEEEENVTPPETAYYRRNFLAIIFLRKMAYLSALLFMYDVPLLQLAGTCGSGVIMLIFMLKFKPYAQSRDAWLNVGSEIILLVIHLVIFILAGDDITQRLSDNQRKNVGWVIVGLCSLLVVYNCYFVLVEQIDQIRSFIRYLIRLRSSKKAKTYNANLTTSLDKTHSSLHVPGSISAETTNKIEKNDEDLTNDNSTVSPWQNQILLENSSNYGTIKKIYKKKAQKLEEENERRKTILKKVQRISSYTEDI